MLSSSPSSSLSSNTDDLSEKPIIRTSTVVPIPSRPKRPRYVSFVSPEIISPELDRRRSWTHRWPLLFIRMTILLVGVMLMDSIIQYIRVCGPNNSASFVMACGITSWAIAFVYILSWMWGRIRRCKSILANSTSGSVVDSEVNESSPLVSHVAKKQSRKVIHLIIHITFLLMWSAAIVNFLLRQAKGRSILIFAGEHTPEIGEKCPLLPETSVHLSYAGLSLWTLATVFIWVDLRRREF
ncbi:hypothetical protein K493DRAFT_41169 [Basidiobolus meristosporus CBS 931.73]|uniref:Uncharacterized protein n=1 Tax=Basidiobolus meristosporus CBS 931.73 TaxID=1314790 RepID=A0A1Y1Y592_9FUNG|nr:hypothetical protein K493DRAFT_41169 [Basidiobolus meristosporus CBS 931.73]|eukprot:ORX92774.1 hypothetical protein K493DRAFT_41169 [Basidiobolus meristosporus CBS 931.73]